MVTWCSIFNFEIYFITRCWEPNSLNIPKGPKTNLVWGSDPGESTGDGVEAVTDFYRLSLFSSPLIIKVMNVHCRQFLNANKHKEENKYNP